MEEEKTKAGHTGIYKIAAVILAAAVFAAGFGLGRQTFPVPEEKHATLKEVQERIDNDYLREADPVLAEQGLSKGVVAALGDPYSVYFSPEELAEYLDGANSRVVGVGAYVRQDNRTGETLITGVLQGGPAQKAGLQKKDRILAVDGVSVEKRILDLIVKDITGEAGTSVSMTVFRPSTGETLTFDVLREAVVFPMVEYEMAGEDTGYIKIIQFSALQTGEFFEAFDRLEAQGMGQLVLDLRSNPGGDLDAAVSIADYLLPDKLPEEGGPSVVVTDQDKHGNRSRFYCNDGHGTDVPIAILTDVESASASEVLSGALRDNGRALLVGEKTFGKGIVQSLFELEDGSGLKLTTRTYSTPSGFLLDGIGLEPDIPAVPPEESAEEQELAQDGQLQAALTALGEIRAGTRDLPAFTAEDDAAEAPAGYMEEAGAAKEQAPDFDLTCKMAEDETFPALISHFAGSAYSRSDDWVGDSETVYARKLGLRFAADGSYVDFTANPLTERVRRAEISMPSEQGADYAMALLEKLAPGMKETQREKLRNGLLGTPYNEDGTLPMVPGGVGCTVYAAEEEGVVTLIIEK